MSDIAITKSRKLNKDEKLAESQKLSRAYRQWHREQLADALAGAHGARVGELMSLLDRLELNSAATLLACVQRTDWSTCRLASTISKREDIGPHERRMRSIRAARPTASD
jgi:hypothetical protein